MSGTGKSSILAHLGEVEPLLRRSCTHEFDAIVPLSAPAEVLLDRIEHRSTNDYGKSAEERRSILAHLAEVEPLLRTSCTHEVDASRPLDDVVAELIAIGR